MDFSEYRKGHYELINSYTDEQRKELLDEISREKEYNPEDYRRWLRNVAKSIEYKYNVKMLCSTQIFTYMLRYNLNDEEAYDLIKKEFEKQLNEKEHIPNFFMRETIFLLLERAELTLPIWALKEIDFIKKKYKKVTEDEAVQIFYIMFLHQYDMKEAHRHFQLFKHSFNDRLKRYFKKQNVNF